MHAVSISSRPQWCRSRGGYGGFQFSHTTASRPARGFIALLAPSLALFAGGTPYISAVQNGQVRAGSRELHQGRQGARRRDTTACLLAKAGANPPDVCWLCVSSQPQPRRAAAL
eukprot:362982-Chlamydomonas_euryale.AAC.11